jgi:hypothetical protein
MERPKIGRVPGQQRASTHAPCETTGLESMTTGGCFRRARASAGARRDEPAPFLPGAQEGLGCWVTLWKPWTSQTKRNSTPVRSKPISNLHSFRARVLKHPQVQRGRVHVCTLTHTGMLDALGLKTSGFELMRSRDGVDARRQRSPTKRESCMITVSHIEHACLITESNFFLVPPRFLWKRKTENGRRPGRN